VWLKVYIICGVFTRLDIPLIGVYLDVDSIGY